MGTFLKKRALAQKPCMQRDLNVKRDGVETFRYNQINWVDNEDIKT